MTRRAVPAPPPCPPPPHTGWADPRKLLAVPCPLSARVECRPPPPPYARRGGGGAANDARPLSRAAQAALAPPVRPSRPPRAHLGQRERESARRRVQHTPPHTSLSHDPSARRPRPPPPRPASRAPNSAAASSASAAGSQSTAPARSVPSSSPPPPSPLPPSPPPPPPTSAPPASTAARARAPLRVPAAAAAAVAGRGYRAAAVQRLHVRRSRQPLLRLSHFGPLAVHLGVVRPPRLPAAPQVALVAPLTRKVQQVCLTQRRAALRGGERTDGRNGGRRGVRCGGVGRVG